MWLVLCEANDSAALWAYEGLKSRGLLPIELINAEMLSQTLRWEHRLGTDDVSIYITLADGRTISNETTSGVLNRLLSVPSEHLLLAQPADRDYATQELTAFFVSWLNALPQPVINRPTPQGLSGRWLHISEWFWLASKAGLPTFDYKQSSHDSSDEKVAKKGIIVPPGKTVNTVIVVEKTVAGALAPPEIIKGCQRLANLSKIAALGVEFASGLTDQWTFVGATPFPDLRLGGQMLLDILASILKGEREENE